MALWLLLKTGFLLTQGPFGNVLPSCDPIDTSQFLLIGLISAHNLSIDKTFKEADLHWTESQSGCHRTMKLGLRGRKGSYFSIIHRSEAAVGLLIWSGLEKVTLEWP